MARWLGGAAVVLLVTAIGSAADDYKLGPDSMPQEGVPKGKVEKFTGKARSSPAPCAITGFTRRPSMMRPNLPA